MTRHVWRVADAGVMLWEPTTEAATATTLQELHALELSYNVEEVDFEATVTSSHDGYYDSDEQDLVLPLIEGFFGSDIKSQLGEDFETETPLNTSRYATGSTEPFSSPCPLVPGEVLSARLLTSSTTSRHFGVSSTKQTPPVRRTLDFEMVAVRKTLDAEAQCSESSGFHSLVALRKLERDEPHHWDEDERELLTILYRFYDDEDVKTLPRVFNAVTSQDLRHSVIRNQFLNHLVLYGCRAYPEFGRVMAIPFHDPQGKYKNIRIIIEETAAENGINLVRRKLDVRRQSGSAQYAKSPTTRRYWKCLVRRAVERERARSRAPLEPASRELPIQTPPLGGITLGTGVNCEDERWSDREDQSIPKFNSAESLRQIYSIGFRAYDKSSFTKYSEQNGFISSKAHCWPRNKPLPPPLNPDGETRQHFMMDTHNHFSISGGTSPYITVCTSLLQTLVKASNMHNPRISVIALNHPLLQEPNKVLHAAETLRMLKSEDLVQWARYKGHAERLVWGSIPPAAIISHFSLSDLQDLANSDERCADLLSLQEFQPGRTTKHVSDRLRSNECVLRKNTARRMAAVARTFGMDDANVELVHIQDFVARFVDGWKINQDPTNGVNANNRIGEAFATTLASRGHHASDIMQAFRDGVQQGTQTIAYYSRRRTRSS